MHLATRWGALALASFALFISAVSAQSDTAPVITPIPDIDSTYAGNPGPGVETFHTVQITATNSPTEFTASGLPPMAIFDRARGTISWDDNSGGSGVYHCTITAANAAGSDTKSFQWRIHPAIYDSGISVPAKPSWPYTYISGDTVPFIAEFSAPVVVTGTPTLSIFGGTRKATYVSGSGTSRLVFEYVPTAADGSITEAVPHSIDLSGGSIATADGLAARVTGRYAPGTIPLMYAVIAPVFPASITANCTVGVAFLIAPSSGRVGQDVSVLSGALPPGMGPQYVAGALGGTPTTAGTYDAVLKISNANGAYLTCPTHLVVNDAPPGGAPPLPKPTAAVITSVTSGNLPIVSGTADPDANVEVDFRSTFGGTNGGTVVAGPDGKWTLPWYGMPLKPGTYDVVAYVRSPDFRQVSDISNTVTTTVPAPPTPDGLTIPSWGPWSVRLQWSTPAAGYERLEIQRSVDGSPFIAVGTWLTSAPTSGVDANVAPSHTYTYRVAVTIGGAVNYSNVVSIQMPPLILSVAAVGGTSVTLNWTVPGFSSAGAFGQISDDGVTFRKWSSYAYYSSSPAQPGGLTPATTYYFRLATGLDSNNPTGFSNVVQATTLAPDQFAPTPLTTAVSWTKATRYLDITIKYTSPVTVTGSPYVPVTLTSTMQPLHASYLSGSGTDTLTFRNVVGDDYGVVYLSPIQLNGGTVGRPDGTSALLFVPTPTPSYLWVDSPYPPPTIGDITITGTVGTPITPVTIPAQGATAYSAWGVTTYGLGFDSNTGVISGTPNRVADHVVVQSAAYGRGNTASYGNITLIITDSPSTPPPPSDTTPPTISAWHVPQVDPSNPQVVDFTVYFTEPVTGFDAGDVVVTTTGDATAQLGTPWPVTGDPAFTIPVTVGGTNGSINLRLTGGAAANIRDAAGNLMPTVDEGGTTYRLTSAPPPPASVPEVSNASVAGQVGTAIGPVQVSATNSPSSFTADGLGAYGLSISAAGVISGTPTQVANGVTVPVTATNAAGTSAPATITLNIQAAPVVNPPPVENPPPVINPPPPGKQGQTVTFTSPVSGVIIGQPITLGATSSAGLPIVYTVISGDADLNGNVLTPRSTATLVVRAASAGNGTYDAASTDVNFGNPQKAAQAIGIVPVGGSVPAEQPLGLAATSSSGLPVTYTVVSGPATITGNTVTFTGTGTVVVRASQAGSDTYAAAADVTLTLTAIPVTRLVNISSRLRVTANDSGGASIAGFVVTGSAPKQMLIRAVGPSLSGFGVANALAEPRLRVYDSGSKLIAENAGWANDAAIASANDAVGAFKLGAGSKDAALLVTLAPGAYTAQVSSTGAGVALIEVYDVAANAAVPTKQLINISTRGAVGTGDDALVGGFVVNGAAPKRVLVRAVGPALVAFGVSGVLADPILKVYDAAGAVVAENNDWSAASGDVDAANTAAGAFALGGGSKDAALVVELAPGAYTAVVTGANNSTGAALVEVYEVP